MESQRRPTIFSITRLICISVFCISVSAHAAKNDKGNKRDPVVTAVTVTNESEIIIDVIGVNFIAGDDVPIVTLGGQVMTIDDGTLIDTFVSASLPTAFLPGDYLLTVSHSKGVGQYGLTVGASVLDCPCEDEIEAAGFAMMSPLITNFGCELGNEAGTTVVMHWGANFGQISGTTRWSSAMKQGTQCGVSISSDVGIRERIIDYEEPAQQEAACRAYLSQVLSACQF